MFIFMGGKVASVGHLSLAAAASEKGQKVPGTGLSAEGDLLGRDLSNMLAW